MLQKIKGIFKKEQNVETFPAEWVERTEAFTPKHDIAVARKEITYADNTVQEAIKGVKNARNYLNDVESGRVEAADQKNGLDKALYMYGNREELLFQQIADRTRDLRDAEKDRAEMIRNANNMVTDAEKHRMEPIKKLAMYNLNGLMSEF